MDLTKVKNNLVVSSNDLVHAKYEFSLWQKRVFVYAISQLERDNKDFQTLKMEVADIIKFFNANDGSSVYNAIIEAPKNLDKTIEVPYMTDKGGLRYGFVKLLQNYSIPADNKEDNQYIEIRFNSDLKPHLLDLKEKFLKYDVGNIIQLQSTYSFRIFEILKSYEFRGSIELNLDFLREVLEVKDKYKLYKDFRIYIIDKAQDDLEKYCDIAFTYQEKKGSKGKKIESLVFNIFKNTKNQKNTEGGKAEKKEKKAEVIFEKKEKLTEVVIEKKEKKAEAINAISEVFESIITDQDRLIAEYSPIVVNQFGVSMRVFMTLVETHTEGEVRNAVSVTQKVIQSGRVGNTAGFFVNALRDNYQNVEQQKKNIEDQKTTEQRFKAETFKKNELDRAQQQAAYTKREGERKTAVILTLIKNDSDILYEAIELLKKDALGKSYDSGKTIEENLKSPMLAGVLMSLLQRLEPHIFET